LNSKIDSNIFQLPSPITRIVDFISESADYVITITNDESKVCRKFSKKTIDLFRNIEFLEKNN